MGIKYGGNSYSDTPGILWAFSEYYAHLFRGGYSQACLLNFNRFCEAFPRLDEEQHTAIEGSLTLDHVQAAICALQGQKSPGPDGLIRDFYKISSPYLPLLLLKVFRVAYEAGFLPPTFYAGYNILIPKSTENSRLRTIDEYPPILLCDVDYKIFCSLQLVTLDLIGSHQARRIRGRCIQTHIHIARSVLESVTDEVDKVALIQIDLEEAFIKMRHGFSFLVLDNMQSFGDVLLADVRL